MVNQNRFGSSVRASKLPEAVQPPTMKFVVTKFADQFD